MNFFGNTQNQYTDTFISTIKFWQLDHLYMYYAK